MKPRRDSKSNSGRETTLTVIPRRGGPRHPKSHLAEKNETCLQLIAFIARCGGQVAASGRVRTREISARAGKTARRTRIANREGVLRPRPRADRGRGHTYARTYAVYAGRQAPWPANEAAPDNVQLAAHTARKC